MEVEQMKEKLVEVSFLIPDHLLSENFDDAEVLILLSNKTPIQLLNLGIETDETFIEVDGDELCIRTKK
jgi:hypothetical protein